MKTRIAIVGFPSAIFIQDLKNQITDGYEISVIHPDEFRNLVSAQHDGYMIAVSRDMSLRQRLIEHLVNFDFPGFTFMHPSAVIFADATIGDGCFVGPFAFVASQATIDDHCLINPYAMVSHRCLIGQGSILHPGTMIAGSVRIGQYCKFNFKSSVLDDVLVADFTEVGASSLISKNVIEPHGFYVGTPARRFNQGKTTIVN